MVIINIKKRMLLLLFTGVVFFICIQKVYAESSGYGAEYVPNVSKELNKNNNVDLGQAEKFINSILSSEMNKEGMKKAEDVYKLHQQYAKPEADKYTKAFQIDNITGVLVLNEQLLAEMDNLSQNLDNKSRKKGLLADTDRFYVFVSESVPMSILESYRDYFKRLNIRNSVNFVLRGCIDGGGYNGCKDFEPTIKFASRIITFDNKSKSVGSLLIDPVLFKTYDVQTVPQVVYAKNVERKYNMGSEGKFDNLKTTPNYWKTVGDWSMDYHLRELQKLSNDKSLKRLLDSLNDD